MRGTKRADKVPAEGAGRAKIQAITLVNSIASRAAFRLVYDSTDGRRSCIGTKGESNLVSLGEGHGRREELGAPSKNPSV
jgi:hypothetical protein